MQESTQNSSIYAINRKRALNRLGGLCLHCGATENLQFDHINNDRQSRKENISYLLSCSWAKVELELKKCQLLCISCHAIKSNKDRGNGNPKHGTWYQYNRLNCRCLECKVAGSEYNRKRYARKFATK
jgi:5-methylcytosine-specific restriction endonuclease McrA